MVQAQYEVPSQGVLFEVVNLQLKNGRVLKYGVATVPSSDGKRSYRVDVTNGRCDCPAWKFSKERKMCKHLKAMGFTDLIKDSKVRNFDSEL